MSPQKCPRCQQVTPRHPDGSLVMHDNARGGLCSGTNCKAWGKTTVYICGIPIEVENVVYDPDGGFNVEFGQ